METRHNNPNAADEQSHRASFQSYLSSLIGNVRPLQNEEFYEQDLQKIGRFITENTVLLILEMSHFLTIVIVDCTELDPGKKAEELMLPYFEGDEDNPSPEAKCDGFVIGGRYDGVIWGKEQHYNLSPGEFQRRYGLNVVKPDDNIRPLSTFVPDLVSYALITPDGRWYDREGKSSDEWLQEFRSILEQHSEKLGVAIDCHC